MGGDGLSFRPRIDTMYRAKNEELIFVKVCVCDKSLECWLHGFSARQGVLARALQSVLESRHRILVLTMCDFGRFVYFFYFSNAFRDSVCNKGMTRLGVFWQAVQTVGAFSVKAVCLFGSIISLCTVVCNARG